MERSGWGFRNSRGFSMIESMVGAAVIGISLVALIKINQNAENMSRSRVVRHRTLQTYTILRDTIKFSSLCTPSFNGLAVGFTPTLPIPANFEQEIALTVPNIRAGSASGDINVISATAPNNVDELDNYRVTSLKMADMFEIPGTNVNGQRDYYAVIYMTLEYLGDRVLFGGGSWKERPVGGVILKVEDATSNVLECVGSTANSISELCTEFGCNYDATATPPCDCPRPNIGCPPGQLLVAIRDNIADCRPWGGRCNAGELLVGAGIDDVTCAPAPALGGTDCTVAAGTTWSVGADTCSATVATVITDGSSGTVSDTMPIRTGDATFSCAAGVLSGPMAPMTCSGGGASICCDNTSATQALAYSGGNCMSGDVFTDVAGNACNIGPGQYKARCALGPCPSPMKAICGDGFSPVAQFGVMGNPECEPIRTNPDPTNPGNCRNGAMGHYMTCSMAAPGTCVTGTNCFLQPGGVRFLQSDGTVYPNAAACDAARIASGDPLARCSACGASIKLFTGPEVFDCNP